MQETMTEAARNAYISGLPSSFLLTSPLDMAHRVGLWLHAHGYSVPREVRMSRGYKVRVRTPERELILDFGADSKSPTLA